MSSEPTVEECLRELREMYPDAGFISVKRQEYVSNVSPKPAYSCFIHINDVGWSPTKTLTEAMDQVRQWHRENKQ